MNKNLTLREFGMLTLFIKLERDGVEVTSVDMLSDHTASLKSDARASINLLISKGLVERVNLARGRRITRLAKGEVNE